MLLHSNWGLPVLGGVADSYPAPIVDEASTTVTYIGYAELGAGLDHEKWMIVRVTKASATTPNGVVITEYATGDMKFTHKWSDRATLTYAR